MRFLYAVLCVLLVSWAAFGQSPAQCPGKCPKQHPERPVGSGGCICLDGKCACNTPAQPGGTCGCDMHLPESGVVTYQEVIVHDAIGRPVLYLRPSQDGLPWIYKGLMTSKSRSLTRPAPAQYTVPFQCKSGST